MAYPSDAGFSFIGHTCLGRTGSVKLSELNTSDAESRVYTTGTNNDLRRVNNNEEADNDCPSEADATSTTGSVGTDNSLAKWIGYTQWETSSPYPNQGSNFNLTDKDGGSSQHAGTADFSWTKPSGYANFPQSYVQQELWVRPCTGSSFPTDCENDSPFVDAPVSRRYAITDGTTAQAAGLTSLGYYVAGVRMLWNDENDGGGYTQTGVGYRIASSLAESGTDYGDSQAIVFRADEFIPCTTITPGLSNTSGNDGACDACDNWNISGNRTTVQVNHTGFLSGKVLYTNGQSCVSGQEISHKWASNDGETAYTVKSSPAGQIGSPTVDCTDTEICEGF